MGSYTNSFKIVKQAYHFIKKGEYSNAVILLDRLITSGIEDIYPLFLLAVAYLYENQFYKADRVMGRMAIIDADFMPYIQLQAFLTLKSSTSIDNAIRTYSDLIEKNPRDPLLHKAKAVLMGVIDFENFQKNCRLTDFVDVPGPGKGEKKRLNYVSENSVNMDLKTGKKRKIKPGIIFGASAIILIAGLTGVLLSLGILENIFRNDNTPVNIREIDMVALSGDDYDLVTKKKSGENTNFYYTAQKVSEDFNMAKNLIKSSRYNEAVAILNKIFHSNVNFMVKEKTDFLIRWVVDVEGRTFEAVPYETVSENPHMYRGYSLKWQGRVANLQKRKDTVSFTLLVNYKDKDIFSGTAEVFSNSFYNGLENGAIVEVESILTSVVGTQRKIYLVAKGMGIK